MIFPAARGAIKGVHHHDLSLHRSSERHEASSGVVSCSKTTREREIKLREIPGRYIDLAIDRHRHILSTMAETMMPAGGGRREPAARSSSYGGKRDDGGRNQHQQTGAGCGAGHFQMPLHYPRYTREEYEAMPEWQLDRLLSEYGLPATGTLHHKRTFAIGAFLWGAGGGNH